MLAVVVLVVGGNGKGAFVARGVEELSRGTFSADKEEASRVKYRGRGVSGR